LKRLTAFAALFLAPAVAWGAEERRVEPGGDLRAVLAEAPAGAVVEVRGGVYPGPLVIERPVTLRGRGFPVIDGGGHGTVLTITAPDVRIEGFEIRGSGDSLDQENSGIALEASGGEIVGNRFEEVLFGIYLRQAAGSSIVGNQIRGMALDLPRRGDAIRVWSSHGVEIAENRVARGRDVVLWYSEDLEVVGNRVTDGRYGLHFMYCDDARIEGNLLEGNSVGAFLMYSRRLRLERNTIAGNHGPSGYGVGLKDMDDARIVGNVFAGNRVGAFFDNSPRAAEAESVVRGNLFAANDLGVVLLPNVVRGRFIDNSFVDNGQQVSVAGGGGDPEANLWRGNHWSDYAGYDADGDGFGDVAMRSEKLFEDLADRRSELRFFLGSPAQEALGFAARAFPLVRPQPRLVDPEPRMAPRPPSGTPPLERRGGALAPLGGALLAGAAFLLIAPRLRRRLPESDTMPEDAMKEDTPSQETEALIEAEGLSKSFGSQRALGGVDFRIAAGEAVALWGPNGAGKTTALRALLGVIPAEGRLRIAGLDPWSRGREVRRGIGFVPQEVQLQDAWSVGEALDFYARLRRAPAGRSEALLEELGLEDEIEKPVGELSGGQRQRLALALALLADPPILFLDEPTANLDAASRRNFLELLRELKRRGKTLIFSSHRPEEVLALADRVLELDRGRLVSDGPPRAAALLGRRRARLWLRFDPERLEAASAVLEELGLEVERFGAQLVVSTAAERKVEVLAELVRRGLEPIDFELETGTEKGDSHAS